MDFVAFEQLVLKVLFETHDPLAAPHLAYLARIPISRAERYLGRMVEQGTIVPRLDVAGQVEYVFAGRRNIPGARRAARTVRPAFGGGLGAAFAGSGYDQDQGADQAGERPGTTGATTSTS